MGAIVRSVVATLLLVAVSGCAGAGEAVVPTTTTAADSLEPTPSTTTSLPTVPDTTTATLPAEPWQGVHPDFDFDQNGLIAPVWSTDAYGSEAFAVTLDELADTGAEWVTLVPTWYQDDFTGSESRPESEDRTTTDDALLSAIERSRNLGLKIQLKPHLDPSAGGPRLAIAPADPAAWFASYTEFITHYARLAEEVGAEQFVVGTELAGTVEATEEWRGVIDEVRAVYSGPVLYAANFDEFQRVGFWDALDAIGIDAYFPLAGAPTTEVAPLMEAWEPIVAELAAFSSEHDRPVVFTEAGYTSQEGTVTNPHEPWYTAILSEEEQLAAYAALLRTFVDLPWFAGAHWWMWYDYVGDEFAKSMGHTPQGKLAEGLLREAWASAG